MNFLLVECLERYDYFFGDQFKVECPTGSGNLKRLRDVSAEIRNRLTRIFLPDENGRRPCHGDDKRYSVDENWKDLVLFYEFFDGDTGRGCGARYKTTFLKPGSQLRKGSVTRCNLTTKLGLGSKNGTFVRVRNLQRNSTLGRCRIGKYMFPSQFANIFFTFKHFN